MDLRCPYFALLREDGPRRVHDLREVLRRKVDRSSISLCPKRSESLPYNGATSATVVPDAQFMNPTQAALLSAFWTASC